MRHNTANDATGRAGSRKAIAKTVDYVDSPVQNVWETLATINTIRNALTDLSPAIAPLRPPRQSERPSPHGS